MEIVQTVRKIDWNLLRQQKLLLLSAGGADLRTEEETQLLDGLVGLIDAIQDAAIKDGLANPDRVFAFA